MCILIFLLFLPTFTVFRRGMWPRDSLQPIGLCTCASLPLKKMFEWRHVYHPNRRIRHTRIEYLDADLIYLTTFLHFELFLVLGGCKWQTVCYKTKIIYYHCLQHIHCTYTERVHTSDWSTHIHLPSFELSVRPIQ